MPNCTHRSGRWVNRLQYQDWDGNDVYKDEWEEEFTCVDIDTHRYKCTQCNEVMYYSGRAKAFYTEGKGELP